MKPFRPYDLYLLLTMVAIPTQDDAVVATLAKQSDPRQTRLYAEASVDPRLAAGIALISEVIRRR